MSERDSGTGYALRYAPKLRRLYDFRGRLNFSNARVLLSTSYNDQCGWALTGFSWFSCKISVRGKLADENVHTKMIGVYAFIDALEQSGYREFARLDFPCTDLTCSRTRHCLDRGQCSIDFLGRIHEAC
jgi:hypothetical protein